MKDVKVPRHGHEFSAAVAEQDKDNQDGQLKELFTTMTSESVRARKEVAATSGEGWSHYQSRSPMLQRPSEPLDKTAASLTDRCRKLFTDD